MSAGYARPLVCYACGRSVEEKDLKNVEGELKPCGCPKCGRLIWEALAVDCENRVYKVREARKPAQDCTVLHWTPATVTPLNEKLENVHAFNSRVKAQQAIQAVIEKGLGKERGVRQHPVYSPSSRPDYLECTEKTKMPKTPQIAPLAGMTPLGKHPSMADTPADESEQLLALREAIATQRKALEALQVELAALKLEKITVPATQHALGSATTMQRDWSKVSSDKLRELHGKYLANSPKWKASKAELTARGIE